MSGWLQGLLTVLVSIAGMFTINVSYRRAGDWHTLARGRRKKTPDQPTVIAPTKVLNGYKPVLDKAVELIEAYQVEMAEMRGRLADCEAHRAEMGKPAPPTRPRRPRAAD